MLLSHLTQSIARETHILWLSVSHWKQKRAQTVVAAPENLYYSRQKPT
jgi:hypothetical protein